MLAIALFFGAESFSLIHFAEIFDAPQPLFIWCSLRGFDNFKVTATPLTFNSSALGLIYNYDRFLVLTFYCIFVLIKFVMDVKKIVKKLTC